MDLQLKDLPPIQELQISAPVDKLVKVGKVASIVDVLAVIESIRAMPPLDLDTVLFKSDGQPIGQIFDVFGAITEPYYSIRFTSREQIAERNVQQGSDVYFLPLVDRTITKFAFIEEIKKIKGTDASWENDNEPPEEAVKSAEFSDDDDNT